MTNLSAAAVTSGTDSNSVAAQPSWKQTVAGVLGNTLEWYDFSLFGFFSDIIADQFFPPEQNENDNLMKSFAIFGGAFLMRPLGGLLIGYIGDKHGRKKALTRSLFLMAIPTTAMAFLPTYASAGIISPILLVICRLIQGISVGGQLPASLIYTVEKHERSKWGYYGALPMTAANVGTLAGNLAGACMRQFLTEAQLVSWGWRIPFLSGILIALVAIWLRKYGDDVHTTAGVYDGADSQIKNPLTLAFAKENRLALLSNTLVPIIWAGGFYLSFVWMAIFMVDLLDPPISGAFWINFGALLLGMTFMLPLAGSLSDRFGRVKLMTISGIFLIIGGPISLIFISKGNGFLAFISQLVLGLLLSGFGGPLPAWMCESFSPQVRLTSASLGYDLAHSVVGGFSPLFATALYNSYGTVSPGWLYVLYGLCSLSGLYVNVCFGKGEQPEESPEPGSNDEGNQELPEIA